MAKTKTPKPPKPQTSPLAELIDVAAVEPHGLILTTTGRYVRILALDRTPNLFSAGAQDREDVIAARRELCASIPDGQELWVLVQRDPMPPELVGAEDRETAHAVARQDLEDGDHDSAQARIRLHRMTASTLDLAATGAIGASWARHYVAVVWTPQADTMRDRLTDLRAPADNGARRVDFRRHYDAAADSAEYAAYVEAALSDHDVITRRIDGAEALALIWERLHPAAGQHPDPERLAALCSPVIDQDGTNAGRRRAAIVNELCAELPDHEIPAASIDDSDPRFLRHGDGTLEEVLYLSRQPQTTDPWWLDPFSLTGLSSTLVVRIRPHERSWARIQTSANARRKNDVLDTQHTKGRRITREDERVAAEVETVEDELQQVSGATLYSVGIYASLRCTWGDEDALKRTAKLRATEMMTQRDGRVMRGARISLRGLAATLPLGNDRLGRTTKWAHSNTGDLLPLSSSRCGHDTGLPIGISSPHGTLERLDPFDSRSGTHVTIVSGGSGTGKTFTVNSLLLRAISRGMRGIIVDRSSTDTGAAGRAASHYDPLLSLVPGSARVSIGGGPGAARINPWDVEDPADPPIERVEALLAIHALLIGEAVGTNDTDRRLSADDRALLSNAITAAYQRCSATDQTPTESVLVDELVTQLHREEDEAMRARITSLLVRLEAFVGDGPLAYLLDAPTSVPTESPLLLFDIAGVPDSLLPAVLTIAMTFIDAQAQRLHAARLAGAATPGYAGRLFALVEEGWKVTKTRAGAAWLDEEARRSRHLAFWLIFITQQLSDLQGEGGEALLSQAASLIIHSSKSGTITPVAEAADLTDTDLAQIRRLTTRKGEFADAFLSTSAGRGSVRVALSPLEYWAIAADPQRDQPLRQAALAQAGGDPYAAIGLLASPSWQQAQADAA
jgi:hypothetical protein